MISKIHLPLTLILILTSSFTVLFSQTLADEEQPGTEHTLTISGSGNIFSNALNQAFFQSLYLGESIPWSVKNGVQLEENNFLFSNLGFEIGMEVKTKAEGIHNVRSIFGFNLFSNRIVQGEFNPDFYRLLLYGNSMFQGQEAQWENDYLVDLHYSGLRLLFGKEWQTQSHRHQIILMPSLLLGHSMQSLEFCSGSLYTGLFGEYLHLEADYSYMRTPDSGTLRVRGIGAGIDFSYRYKNLLNNLDISLSLNDIGTIFWNKEAEKLSKDTSLNLLGSNIDFLPDFNFNFDEDFVFSQLANELYFDALEEKNFFYPTPANLHLAIGKHWTNSGVFAEISYVNFIQISQLHWIQGKLNYSIKPWFSLSIEPGMLSFARPYVNFSSKIQWSDSFSLALRYGDIMALWDSENSYMQQANISLQYHW